MKTISKLIVFMGAYVFVEALEGVKQGRCLFLV